MLIKALASVMLLEVSLAMFIVLVVRWDYGEGEVDCFRDQGRGLDLWDFFKRI